MKKTLFTLSMTLVIVLSSFWSVSAQVFTLDLSNPLNPAEFTFDPATGEWTETFNGEDYPTIDFEHFSFSHIINNNGYGGASWDGFTVSVSGDDANQSDFISNQWGNMAGGGIKTDANGKVIKDNGKVQVEKGIPYLVAYWSFYTDLTEDMPSLITPFDDMYEPVGMYVNASPWPYYGNLGHDNFARALDQEGDYFKLIIHGLDENYEDNEGATVEYYLAKNEVGGIENLYQSADWEWVDLSPLGEVYGLYYTMETTDMSYGWPNTSTYFCMDKLQVKIPGTDTRMKTPETKIAVSPNPFTEFIVINSHTSELATIYDLSGKVILTVKLHAGSNRINTSALAKGAYIVKTGGNAVKIVK